MRRSARRRPEDVELYPDVEAAIGQWWDDHNGLIIGVTNQGVVGYGTLTVTEVEAITAATSAAFMQDPFDWIEVCYALPAAAGGKVRPYHYRSLRRKPDYGMLVSAEVRAFREGVIIDWERSLMVGDRPEDAACAAKAGIAFKTEEAFFSRPRRAS